MQYQRTPSEAREPTPSRRMQHAPSLTEAPPSRDDPRQGQQRPMSAGSAATDQGRTPSTPSSPHMRLDTTNSTSPTVTTVTSGSAVAAAAAESGGDPPPYIAGDEVSPTYAAQAIFSVKDGSELGGIRRPSRRRTGPLSASQREKAALIRKLGACNDCRRRRVAVSIYLVPHLIVVHLLSTGAVESRDMVNGPKIAYSDTYTVFPPPQTVPSEPPQHDLGRRRAKVQVTQPYARIFSPCRAAHQSRTQRPCVLRTVRCAGNGNRHDSDSDDTAPNGRPAAAVATVTAAPSSTTTAAALAASTTKFPHTSSVASETASSVTATAHFSAFVSRKRVPAAHATAFWPLRPQS